MSFFEEINSHKYIFLSGINEPEENSLSFVIEEAQVSGEHQDIIISGVNLGESRAIEVTDQSKRYKIHSDSYISYGILDESYALPDDSEVYDGRLFCIYKKSNFLEYTSKASFACEDHPGPSKHYGFNCLNHIIDIISIDEPKIEPI